MSLNKGGSATPAAPAKPPVALEISRLEHLLRELALRCAQLSQEQERLEHMWLELQLLNQALATRNREMLGQLRTVERELAGEKLHACATAERHALHVAELERRLAQLQDIIIRQEVTIEELRHEVTRTPPRIASPQTHNDDQYLLLHRLYQALALDYELQQTLRLVLVEQIEHLSAENTKLEAACRALQERMDELVHDQMSKAVGREFVHYHNHSTNFSHMEGDTSDEAPSADVSMDASLDASNLSLDSPNLAMELQQYREAQEQRHKAQELQHAESTPTDPTSATPVLGAPHQFQFPHTPALPHLRLMKLSSRTPLPRKHYALRLELHIPRPPRHAHTMSTDILPVQVEFESPRKSLLPPPVPRLVLYPERVLPLHTAHQTIRRLEFELQLMKLHNEKLLAYIGFELQRGKPSKKVEYLDAKLIRRSKQMLGQKKVFRCASATALRGSSALIRPRASAGNLRVVTELGVQELLLPELLLYEDLSEDNAWWEPVAMDPPLVVHKQRLFRHPPRSLARSVLRRRISDVVFPWLPVHVMLHLVTRYCLVVQLASEESVGVE